MNTQTCLQLRFAWMAIATLMGALAWSGEAPLPDLTKGTDGIDLSLTYNLGATGMRGWIYSPRFEPNLGPGDGEYGRRTGSSRQILVTHVGPKTPADGVMQVGDVILGIDDKPFTFDARKSIALAIQEAEKSPVEKKADAQKKKSASKDSAQKTSSGSLVLLRWRAGKTESVELKMRVMGTYSETAPYNCPKSAKILEDACAALQNEKDMWREISGLAMLASGDPRFFPQLKALAQEVGPPTLKLKRFPRPWVWELGYRGIFLSEYYLATGDKSVEHAINEITVFLAQGQDMFGCLGHGISELTDDGKLHGYMPGYGPVNECGIACNLAIALGKRCGVKHPDVDAALVRANGFFGYYVDKGYLPYGQHEPCYGPGGGHANNGKGPIAAAFFGVQGDRLRETQYWSKMSVASYPNTENGHCGQGFSYLWRLVGANMGGPEAAAAFFKEMSWHFDLSRRCDGSFVYDGTDADHCLGGKTADNTYAGRSDWYNVSPNAMYVLSYAVALKKIHITGSGLKPVTAGKDKRVPAWLTKQEVDEAIAAGRFEQKQKDMNVQELTAALGNWSPTVRIRAAAELSSRPGAQSLVPQLMAAAEGSNPRLRLGACEALNQLKAQQALPVFIRLLSHEDHGLRWLAARGIKGLGAGAQSAAINIIKAFIDTAEKSDHINWDDPIQLTHRELIDALFRGGLTDVVKKMDPNVVLAAVRVASKNANNEPRSFLFGYLDHLSADEVAKIVPEVVALATRNAPANAMSAGDVRYAAYKLLAKFHFREGIKAGILASKGKIGLSVSEGIMKELVTYGSAAKEIIPDLHKIIDEYKEIGKDWSFNENVIPTIEKTIKAIESAQDHPPLLSGVASSERSKESRK